VVELASKLDDGHVANLIPTRIVDGGTVQVDQPLPLAPLLRPQTMLHLRSHRDQLAALATTQSIFMNERNSPPEHTTTSKAATITPHVWLMPGYGTFTPYHPVIKVGTAMMAAQLVTFLMRTEGVLHGELVQAQLFGQDLHVLLGAHRSTQTMVSGCSSTPRRRRPRPREHLSVHPDVGHRSSVG
jgi:hypothetical protein